MNILYVTPYVPSLIRVRPYNFIRSLGRLGHSVTVLCATDGSDADRAALEELRAEAADVESFEVSRARSVRNCLSALATGEPLQAAYSYHPEMAERARALARGGAASNPTSLRADGEPDTAAPSDQDAGTNGAPGMPGAPSANFDVIHVEHLRASRLLCAIDDERRATGIAVPLVFDSVDSISLLFEQAAKSGAQLRTRVITSVELQRTRRHEAELLSRCDRAVVTSRLDMEALDEQAERQLPAGSVRAPVSVVTNGVDLDYFQPLAEPGAGGGSEAGESGAGESCAGESAAAPTVVLSGKMSYHANVAAALYFAGEVLPLVWAEEPAVRFLIVGKDPPDSVLSLAADDRVDVTGAVDDLRPYLGGATVAVCPAQYAVGIQNKVLEAMAMGTPVVTTPASLAGLEARVDEELLVGADPSEFAAAVVRVCRDAELSARLGRAGRAYVELHHDWSRQAERLIEVYQQAAGTCQQAGQASRIGKPAAAELAPRE